MITVDFIVDGISPIENIQYFVGPVTLTERLFFCTPLE